MRIIGRRPQAWFLAEDEGRLFLDVNCNSGVVGLSLLTQLTRAERAAWTTGGDAFLDRLPDQMQNAGPQIVATRGAGEPWLSRFDETVSAWLAAQRAALADPPPASWHPRMSEKPGSRRR